MRGAVLGMLRRGAAGRPVPVRESPTNDGILILPRAELAEWGAELAAVRRERTAGEAAADGAADGAAALDAPSTLLG